MIIINLISSTAMSWYRTVLQSFRPSLSRSLQRASLRRNGRRHDRLFPEILGLLVLVLRHLLPILQDMLPRQRPRGPTKIWKLIPILKNDNYHHVWPSRSVLTEQSSTLTSRLVSTAATRRNALQPAHSRWSARLTLHVWLAVIRTGLSPRHIPTLAVHATNCAESACMSVLSR